MAVLAVVVLAVATGGGGERTPEERVRALEGTIRCPTCKGQSVRESAAPASQAVRAEIQRRVDAGESDGEIRAFLVSRYGESILLQPPASGVAGLVWALPVVLVVVGVAGLAVLFRRWRPVPVTVSDDDRVLVERARRSRPPEAP
jgi:cytochrome c-type biogenesis protein CcmH